MKNKNRADDITNKFYRGRCRLILMQGHSNQQYIIGDYSILVFR